MSTVAQQQSILTGCGICGAEYCPHLSCRVCSTCSDCDQVEGKRPPTPSKGDPAEQRRLHALAEERRQALEELQSNQCPTCQRRKREMKSFCKVCFKSLPAEIANGLYLSFANGYLPYYRKAKELLSK